MASTLSAFRIGGGGTSFVDGEIDEVRIWSDARTQTEIQTNLSTALIGNTLSNFALSGAGSNWVTSGSLDETPPCPQELFTSEVSSSQIDLNWSDRSFNETGFTIERSDGNNVNFVFLDLIGADVTTYSDNSVTADNGYFYRIIANGASGNSDPSNEKFGSTLTSPGNSLKFDGVDDYVPLGEIIPQSYTKEAWIKIESGSTRNNFVSSDDVVNGHYLYAPDVNAYQLTAGHFIGSVLTSVIDPDPLDFDTWYHVAVSSDAETQEMILYKNGMNVGSQMVGNHSDPSVLLGAHNFGNLLTGNLDEVRIWDDVRTPVEILNNFGNQMTGNEPNLVAYYRMIRMNLLTYFCLTVEPAIIMEYGKEMRVE